MTTEQVWLAVGLAGQAFFTMRFLVQWIATERRRKSVVPREFWYFSIGGGLTLLFYALHLGDPVFILGQSAGLIVYSRNLYFVRREGREAAGA
ncbi:MAG: hypothetical protein DMD91_21425 [Candidatus Rokuibacteriota bacterium]|nr:MAG: hypothetical protein DMD91_21425 [Candidatus Rokubacteria bacterium]